MSHRPAPRGLSHACIHRRHAEIFHTSQKNTHWAFSFTHRLAVATDIDVQHALPQRLQSVHRLLRPAQGQDSAVSSQQILNRKKIAYAVWLVGNDRFSWGWKLGWKVIYICACLSSGKPGSSRFCSLLLSTCIYLNNQQFFGRKNLWKSMGNYCFGLSH